MKRAIRYLLDRTPYLSKLRRQVSEQGYYEAGHYYSPIPAKSEVAANLKKSRPLVSPADVDLRRDSQLGLIKALGRYYQDIPFPEKQTAGSRYYFDQIWFGHSDAIMLYGLIRHFKFHRIIEIGSGFSSAVMLDTLEKFGDGNFDLTFIEPYPDRLKSVVAVNSRPNVRLIEKKIQDVPLELFDALQAGDLLFVDSSHVMKYHSDLHRILFGILPRLKSGVMVHFHDIFYPFEYPDAWLGGGRYWNECYVLHAFLSSNSNWEVVLFNHYANLEFPDVIQNELPLCRKNFGGSLYLRKK